jgi:hypothetical protein
MLDGAFIVCEMNRIGYIIIILITSALACTGSVHGKNINYNSALYEEKIKEINIRIDNLNTRLSVEDKRADNFGSQLNLIDSHVSSLEKSVAAERNDLAQYEEKNKNTSLFDKIVGPVSGAATSAVLAGIFAVLIAVGVTWFLKQTDNTHDFSKRYWDVIEDGLNLNKDIAMAKIHDKAIPVEIINALAESWWFKYFDLMLFQYEYFKRGALKRERFAHWMKWRWLDCKDAESGLKVGGKNYIEGWEIWSKHLGNSNNEFVPFLTSIHNQASATDALNYALRSFPSVIIHKYLK